MKVIYCGTFTHKQQNKLIVIYIIKLLMNQRHIWCDTAEHKKSEQIPVLFSSGFYSSHLKSFLFVFNSKSYFPYFKQI